MRRRYWITTGVVAIALATVAATGALAEEREEKIPVKKLPRNVVAVVKVVCPGGTILSAVREIETERGKTVIEYELKVKQPGGKIVEVEVELDKAGNIRKVEVGDDDDDDDD